MIILNNYYWQSLDLFYMRHVSIHISDRDKICLFYPVRVSTKIFSKF